MLLLIFALIPFLLIAQVDTKAQKDFAKLKKEHDSVKWTNCFVVLLNGDTIHGKVKNKWHRMTNYQEDFNEAHSLYECNILFAYSKDEHEEKFLASAFRELWLTFGPSSPIKYITSVKNGGQGGERGIYRVVIDGKCQLVQESAEGLLSTYVYYNEKLIFICDNSYNGFKAGIMKRCKETFIECPSVLNKIENKTYKSYDDLRPMVEEFNQCIGMHE